MPAPTDASRHPPPPLLPWQTPVGLHLPDELGPGLDRERLFAGLEQLLACEGIQAVVLFGSRANGTARSDSDVDLAVICREEQLGPAIKQQLVALPPSPGPAWLRRGSGAAGPDGCGATGRVPLACDEGCGPSRRGARRRSRRLPLKTPSYSCASWNATCAAFALVWTRPFRQKTGASQPNRLWRNCSSAASFLRIKRHPAAMISRHWPHWQT